MAVRHSDRHLDPHGHSHGPSRKAGGLQTTRSTHIVYTRTFHHIVGTTSSYARPKALALGRVAFVGGRTALCWARCVMLAVLQA